MLSLPARMLFVFAIFFLFSQDTQPPDFGVTCPAKTLLVYAERKMFSALVNWTQPVATDNSGVSITVTSNYQSPRRFSQGTHVITYAAVDQSGNKATCTLLVIILGSKDCIQ